MLLAERIRKVRIAYNLTQADVAEKSKITPSAYGQIERNAGNSTFYTLEKIAIAIGVSTSFLVDIRSQNHLEEKNKF